MRADRSEYFKEYRRTHKEQQHAAYLRHRNRLVDDGYNKMQREWYQQNKKYALDKNRANRVKYNQFSDDYKGSHSCARCGESDFRCLDFHHISGVKTGTLGSDARKNNWGIERRKREMAKCEIICANCHRREHYDERHADGPRVGRQKIREFAEAMLSA